MKLGTQWAISNNPKLTEIKLVIAQIQKRDDLPEII